MILKKNQEIKLNNGKLLEVQALLGDGGQGEVYLASIDGRDYAFKVYKNEETPDFKFNLRNNIDRGSPSEEFLWPQMYVPLDDKHFGYIMDLRPQNYKSFVSYLNGKVEFKNTATLLKWCISLCLCFKKLHERGFSYQDLNDGSFFLDPDTGRVLICDNDNVTADKKNLGILGKMRYMAPEIVRGDSMPDVHSDRFSLAVILFMALCKGYPYEGNRLKNYDIIDETTELEMFGTDPIFVYHKTNKDNRPIRGYHTALIKRWPCLPLYVKEAFHRTFVDGLDDRENERTTELEWIRLLTRYRDELVSCACGKQYAYGLYENKDVMSCPFCNMQKPERLVLTINKSTIVIEPGKEIYETHLDKYSTNYNEVIGKVIANKNNPGLWGIRVGQGGITIEDSKGTTKEIASGGIIPIVRNLTINFNENIKGEIK